MVTKAGLKRYNTYLRKVTEAGFYTENEFDSVEPIMAEMGKHIFEIQDWRFFGRRASELTVFWAGSKCAVSFKDIDNAIEWMKIISDKEHSDV